MADKDYKIDFTDPAAGSILVPAGDVRGPAKTTIPRTDAPTDIDLMGRGHSLWGEHILENLLHMLENFASDEDPIASAGSPPIIQPDPLTGKFAAVTPVEGELWYNKNAQSLYVYRGTGSPATGWERLGLAGALDNYYNKSQVDAKVPVPGAVEMYAGDGTALDPNVWVLCNGDTFDSVANTQYAALYNAIGTKYGGTGANDFNVPDMKGAFPLGGVDADLDRGSAGGAATHTLILSETPGHTHIGTTNPDGSHLHTGTTVADGSHLHTGSTGSAGSHTHTGSSSAAGNHRHWTDGGAAASSTGSSGSNKNVKDQAGWTDYNGTHTHGMALNNAGTHSHSFASMSLAPDHTHGFTTDTFLDHTHGFTTGSSGGDGTHNNMPPYVTMNYIIKL